MEASVYQLGTGKYIIETDLSVVIISDACMLQFVGSFTLMTQFCINLVVDDFQ